MRHVINILKPINLDKFNLKPNSTSFASNINKTLNIHKANKYIFLINLLTHQMFKKYKIRKSKNMDVPIPKQKQLHVPVQKHKTELEKLKSLFITQNKKMAFKRILNLKQKSFDHYLYFITLTVLSEYLYDDSELIIRCIKRIIRSEMFECVNDLFFEYYKIKQVREIDNILNGRNKRELVANTGAYKCSYVFGEIINL